MPALSDAERVCGEKVFNCVCILEPHPRGAAHQCKCGGSWLGDEESLQIVHLPSRIVSLEDIEGLPGGLL